MSNIVSLLYLKGKGRKKEGRGKKEEGRKKGKGRRKKGEGRKTHMGGHTNNGTPGHVMDTGGIRGLLDQLVRVVVKNAVPVPFGIWYYIAVSANVNL